MISFKLYLKSRLDSAGLYIIHSGVTFNLILIIVKVTDFLFLDLLTLSPEGA